MPTAEVGQPSEMTGLRFKGDTEDAIERKPLVVKYIDHLMWWRGIRDVKQCYSGLAVEDKNIAW